jgi:hypothetical protein
LVMTTFAVATPHALVLTVSHGLLLCQPLICAGMDAAFSTCSNATPTDHQPLQSSQWIVPRARAANRAGLHRSARSCDLTNPQPSQPAPAVSPLALPTLRHLRDISYQYALNR